MDKLEKAMEKARKQRETTLATTAPLGLSLSSGSPQILAGAQAVALEESQLERNRILAHHQRSPEADVFRILRTQVLQIMNKSDFKTLAITSPRHGDGKTTIALNLAVSIALDMNQTVLLVDLDLRKPTLDHILGLENKTGLTDHLLNDTPIPDCLVRMPFNRMCVLPGGKALDGSSELLGSPRMAALAQELKTRYYDRLVIYDMPPVLAQDDSIAFLPHVDATLLVVNDGVTRVNDLKSCLDHLSGTNIIGTVLNNAMQTT